MHWIEKGDWTKLGMYNRPGNVIKIAEISGCDKLVKLLVNVGKLNYIIKVQLVSKREFLLTLSGVILMKVKMGLLPTYLRTYNTYITYRFLSNMNSRYYDIGLNLPTLNFLYLQKVHASSGLATVPEWPWDVEGGGSRTRDWQLPSSPLVDCVVSGSWWKFTRVVLSFFY